MNLSKLEEKDIKNKLNEYDLLITGSDQVWNKKITSNDLVYFFKDIQQHKMPNNHHQEDPTVIDRLLPWSEDLPEQCHLKKRRKKCLH